MSPSALNPEGYFEDTWLALLNDQLIRLRFGNDRSFLHIRATDSPNEEPDSDFRFDLTPETVQIPSDFESRVRHYTGHDWDIWGLTRMAPGGKWHACYSEAGIADFKGIRRAIGRVEHAVAEGSATGGRLLIKDPRLVFTLPMLDLDADIIVLERLDDDVVKSMRSHYGPRLFTQSPYEGYTWVSNHFNYCIQPQTFEDYMTAFDTALVKALAGRRSLRVSLSSLVEGRWGSLEDFLGASIPTSVRKSGTGSAS